MICKVIVYVGCPFFVQFHLSLSLCVCRFVPIFACQMNGMNVLNGLFGFEAICIQMKFTFNKIMMDFYGFMTDCPLSKQLAFCPFAPRNLKWALPFFSFRFFVCFMFDFSSASWTLGTFLFENIFTYFHLIISIRPNIACCVDFVAKLHIKLADQKQMPFCEWHANGLNESLGFA